MKPDGYKKDEVDWAGGGIPESKENSATFTTQYSKADFEGYTITATLETSNATRHVWVIGGQRTGPTHLCLGEKIMLKAAAHQYVATKYLWEENSQQIKSTSLYELYENKVEIEGIRPSTTMNDAEVKLKYSLSGKDCYDTHQLTVFDISMVLEEKEKWHQTIGVRAYGTAFPHGAKVTVTFSQLGEPEPPQTQIVRSHPNNGNWKSKWWNTAGLIGTFQIKAVITGTNCSVTEQFELP